MPGEGCRRRLSAKTLTDVVKFLLTPRNQTGTNGNCFLIGSMEFEALFSYLLSFSARVLKTQSKIIGIVVWIAELLPGLRVAVNL